MHSIRWRLVLSYLSLTLVTVLALGLLAFSLIQNHFRTQELAVLQSNAEVVARQAEPLMTPVVKLDDLYDLVSSTGYLTDARVRILSPRGVVLADSGTPRYLERMLWIPADDVSQLRLHTEGLPPEIQLYLLNVNEGDNRGILLPEELAHAVQSILGPDVKAEPYLRGRSPWGLWLVPPDASGDAGTAAGSEARSNQVVEVQIGAAGRVLGRVQILESPNYQQATLEAMLQPFLLAAAAALLLSGLIGLIIGRRLSAPIITLSDTAGRMGTGELSVRVPEQRKDELGQLGRQFNHMADRLEASFREVSTERDTLRQFIGDASHELRTPVTALRNFIELLQGQAGRRAKTRDEFLAESQHQVERLEWITANLLNLSRLDGGLSELQRTGRPASEVLEAVASPFRAPAAAKQVTLTLLPAPPSLTVAADQALLELALTNLVDNALKFTPTGGSIELAAAAAPGGVRFSVQDSGPGIDPQDLPHIFDRFYRGRNAEHTGSGLGLALVKSVVEAHGGELAVESEPGAGTTFTILLPA